jgi:hypothetical protein
MASALRSDTPEDWPYWQLVLLSFMQGHGQLITDAAVVPLVARAFPAQVLHCRPYLASPATVSCMVELSQF